jgi:hypothetical protein
VGIAGASGKTREPKKGPGMIVWELTVVGSSRLVGLVTCHIIDLALSFKISTLARLPAPSITVAWGAVDYLDGDIALLSLGTYEDLCVSRTSSPSCSTKLQPSDGKSRLQVQECPAGRLLTCRLDYPSNGGSSPSALASSSTVIGSSLGGFRLTGTLGSNLPAMVDEESEARMEWEWGGVEGVFRGRRWSALRNARGSVCRHSNGVQMEVMRRGNQTRGGPPSGVFSELSSFFT